MGDLIKNKFDEIIEKFRQEGKVNQLNQEESSKIFNAIDSNLMEFRKEVMNIDKKAEMEAASIQISF